MTTYDKWKSTEPDNGIEPPEPDNGVEPERIPASLVEHEADYKDNAWRSYSIAELGGIVAFFVKRSTHRTDPAKAAKDLHDAQNYLDMIQAHIDSWGAAARS